MNIKDDESMAMLIAWGPKDRSTHGGDRGRMRSDVHPSTRREAPRPAMGRKILGSRPREASKNHFW